MGTPSSIGPKIGYDIKDKINDKYSNALTAASPRSVRTISGDHVGKIKRHTGGIYAGGVHLVSDCETTTTSSTSRGVWSAKTVGSSVSAASTYNKTGTNSIKLLATAAVAANDGAVFTCTSGYELDLSDMNFIGFWLYTDDNINVFDAASGDLTIRMYKGTTKVYEYTPAAYTEAHPHGTLFGASATEWYMECPITSSEIQTGCSMSNITSIEILKTTTAMTNTKYLAVDYVEAYEISAGGFPFKHGRIEPWTDSGSGVTRGDWIELSSPAAQTVKTATTDDAVVIIGKACNTAAASGVVYVLREGLSVAVADESSMCSAGDGIGLADASGSECDDTGLGTVQGQFIAKAMEVSGTDLDMTIVMVQAMGGTDGA